MPKLLICSVCGERYDDDGYSSLPDMCSYCEEDLNQEEAEQREGEGKMHKEIGVEDV